jgi:citrate lyase subunit beta / citryl-CoA lyase
MTESDSVSTARSYLYVPGDRADVLAKAATRGADALIIDLEDAVAPPAKEAARAIVGEYLAGLPAAGSGEVEIWIRVNGDGVAATDIAAVAAPAVSGFCLAKTETPSDVVDAAVECTAAEAALGLDAGTFALAPLLESAAAVLDARAIASASSRVTRLQVGEADLRAEIGVTLGPDERELLQVRSSIVLASAAAGVEPPVGPVSTNFRDLDALRTSTEALARLGYRGRACIHPAQAAVVNEVFTPDPEALAAARDLVARFDAAAGAGAGVFVGPDGRMVDLAVIRQARRLLTYAR